MSEPQETGKDQTKAVVTQPTVSGGRRVIRVFDDLKDAQAWVDAASGTYIAGEFPYHGDDGLRADGGTKYGDKLPEGGTADLYTDDEEVEDGRPTFEVGRHTVQIDDNRDSHGYEYGLDWLFSFEEGVLVAYSLGHWLEGRTQSDYMGTPAWEDVPEGVKANLREELNVQEIETDLPDFYGDRNE